MDNNALAGVLGAVVGGVITIILLFSFEEDTEFYKNGYEKGQIDALTGNVKYELVTQPDSTRVWVEIVDKTH